MLNEKHIRKLMLSQGITSRQLAMRVGVSEAMISYALRGERNIRLKTAIMIADALKCRLDDIVIRAEHNA